jgi:hypothetical protein
VQQASVVGSDALLLQTKLEEALRLTAATDRPNPLRTSMCCHLLACVVKAMRPQFAEAMLTLSHELLGSIYYAPEGAKPIDIRAATPIYFRGTPFFMLGQELDRTKTYAILVNPHAPPCVLHGGDALTTPHPSCICRGHVQFAASAESARSKVEWP